MNWRKWFVAVLLVVQTLLVQAGADDSVTVTDYRKTYLSRGTFAEIRENLELAITGRGIVINNVSHIGDMLSRTGKDIGAEVEVYAQAEAIEFCSATLSRAMMEADRHNIIFCPYIIAVYTLPGERDRVYLSYRRPPPVGNSASRESLRDVEALLDAIVDETVQP